LYVDASGQISRTQTFFGLDERTEVYENTNAESLEELEREGVDQLTDRALGDEIEVIFDAEDDQYDVQDIVSAADNVTGLVATAEIVKKIVVVENGQATISYEVG
jgi:hypothetical protein